MTTPSAWELVRAIYPHTGNAAVIGFTGRPGGQVDADRRVDQASARARSQIAVLSIDPSSPFTGGAVLGDRIRLHEHFLDAVCSSARWPRAARWAASPRLRCRRRC